MTTACDLPIDLSTKSHHQHHHHAHHHHHHGHHHHHLLAAVHHTGHLQLHPHHHHPHHHDHHHHPHHHHHHLSQLQDAEELAFQQLQLEYLSHQQLCAAFANHPLNRLYAAASHNHHQQHQQQQQHSPPQDHHNHQKQHQFDQLTINTWSPPAHQLSQHLSLNSHQQQQAALCLNQSAAATAAAAALATGIIGERSRGNHEQAAKFYELQKLDERDFDEAANKQAIGESCEDEKLPKGQNDDELSCGRHSANHADVVLCLERRHEEATSIIEENPSPIDLHRSSTSSTHSNASSPSSSSASITSTSSSSHSSSTFLGGGGGGGGHLQSGDKKRINRPLTGKHVKHGTGASVRTLVALRKVIRQRQQLGAK